MFGLYLGYLIATGVAGVIVFLCYAFFKPFWWKTQQKKMFKRINKY